MLFLNMVCLTVAATSQGQHRRHDQPTVESERVDEEKADAVEAVAASGTLRVTLDKLGHTHRIGEGLGEIKKTRVKIYL
jgi:hypothetical protein